MKLRIPIVAGVLLASAFGIGPATAEMAPGAVLANTCYSCHGTEGKSLGAMPTIHGKPAEYLSTTLKAFRDGQRPSTVMQRITKGFNDAEIDALAAYLGQKSK